MDRIRGIVVRTLTILAGFWIADLAAARIPAGIAAGESIERIMDGMTTMLHHPTALGFDRTSLLCGLGGAGAVGLFHLNRWSMSQRNWREGEEYGSARWSTSREMAPYTDSDTRQNLQMTATEGLSLDAQATRRNLNTAVMDYLLENSTFKSIPQQVMDYQVNQCLNYYYSMANYYGYDLDSFVQTAAGYENADALLEGMSDSITTYSKEALLYQAVAETLGIVPTQAQIDTYSSYTGTYGENYCTMVALMDAVTDALTESAVVS